MKPLALVLSALSAILSCASPAQEPGAKSALESDAKGWTDIFPDKELKGWTRVAVDPKATPGLQPEPFGGAPAYVMPSTSGLNAHARLADLVGHMRAALVGSGGG